MTAGLALLLVYIAQARIAAIGRHVIARCRVGVAAFVAASPVLVGACVAIGDAAVSGKGILALAAVCCVGLVAPGRVGKGAKLTVYIVVTFGASGAVTGIIDVGVLQVTIFYYFIAANRTCSGMLVRTARFVIPFMGRNLNKSTVRPYARLPISNRNNITWVFA